MNTIFSMITGAIAGVAGAYIAMAIQREDYLRLEDRVDQKLMESRNANLEISKYYKDALEALNEIEFVHWEFSRSRINQLLADKGMGSQRWLSETEMKAEEAKEEEKTDEREEAE